MDFGGHVSFVFLKYRLILTLWFYIFLFFFATFGAWSQVCGLYSESVPKASLHQASSFGLSRVACREEGLNITS